MTPALRHDWEEGGQERAKIINGIKKKKNSELAAMLYELVPAKAIIFRLWTFAPWLENEIWQGCAP